MADLLEKIKALRNRVDDSAVDLELEAIEDALRGRAEEMEGLGRELEKERNARLRAEAAHRETERRLDQILSQLTEVYFILDEGGRFVHVTSGVKQALGYFDLELPGRTLVSLAHAEDAEKLQKKIDNAWQGKETYLEETYRLVQKDGMLRHFRISNRIIEESGRPVLAGVLTDVSELCWAEAIITVIQERFHRLFHSSPVGLLEVDYSEVRRYFDRLLVTGRGDMERYLREDPAMLCHLAGQSKVTQANPAALEIFEAPRKDQIVFDPFEGCDTDQMAHFGNGLLSLFGEGASQELEAVITTNKGIERPILLKWLVVQGHEENLDRVIVAVVDITERKKVEEATVRAKEAAEAANRAKTQFLANVTHEVRTPMNGILGMIELALSTPLTPQQKEYLLLARLSAETLLTLINDILDLSKIEAGKLDLELRPFNLCESMADTLDTLAVSAHEKGLELVLDIEPGVPAIVVGDVLRLRQVVTNLCSNAIKFTEQGEIVLRVGGRREEDGALGLDFQVQDTGIGIPYDKQTMIFSAFNQVDASTTRRYGGTGLGLAISKQLVQMMGGEISVESTPGQGSIFHFHTRFQSPAGEFPQAPEPRIFNFESVLVVDDNATSRNVLAQTLDQWGLNPRALGSGRESLAELERAAREERPYALVLLDSHMPSWDGFETARRIKEHDFIKDTPLLMLTPIGRRGDVERCQELGAAGRISKPIRPAMLKKTLAELLKGIEVSSQLDADLSPGESGARSLKILMAEDNLVLQKLQSTVLTQWGHDVRIVDNGLQAVEAYRESGPYDLLLLDVQMPEMDGLEATRAIREYEKQTGTRIPIIALTGRAMKGDREECIQAGMDGVIPKPFTAEDLRFTMNAVMTGDHKTIGPSSPERLPDEATDPFDPDAFLHLVGHDKALASSMIDTFMSDLPKQMGRIRNALNQADPKTLMQTAHAIKGAIRIFAAMTATIAARDLEFMGRNRNLRGAEEAWKKLEREVERLKDALLAFKSRLPEY